MEGITYIPGKPRQYRADCQAGQFKIGADKHVGKILKMEILSWRVFDDELFGYPFQSWCEIIFVDPSNIVASILLKTGSLDNFINLTLEVAQSGHGLGHGITTAKMQSRSNREGGKYFAVSFEWEVSKEDRILELPAFASEHDLYSTRLADLIPVETQLTA
jgi:hypothetical protein